MPTAKTNTRLCFTAICFFLAVLPSFSQRAQVDSLLSIPEHKRDTTWIDETVTAAYREVYSDPASSAATLRTVADVAQKKGFESKMPRIFVNQGICCDVMAMPDSALYFYRKALNVAKRLDDTKMVASAHNNIGLIHWNLETLDSALIHYQISEKLFAQIGNRSGLTSTMNNIGLIYVSMHRQEDAIPYFHQVKNLAKEDSSLYFESVAYQNLGLCYDKPPYLDSSLYYLDKAIPLQIELNNSWGLAKSYHTRGSVKIILLQMNSAIDDFNQAIAINKRLNNLNALASNYFRASVAYPYLNKYDTALAYLDTATSLCPEIQDFNLCKKINQLQALLLVRKLDVSLYERLDQSIDITDSLYTLKLDGKILELQEQYEAEKKEQELRIANLELKEQELKTTQRQRLIWGLTGLIFLLICLGILFFRYRSRLNALKTSQKVYEERSRISKDLHDSVGAQLTAMSTRIDLLERNENNSLELTNIRNEATATISLLRDTIWAMHREEFTVLQFIDRVEEYGMKVLPKSLTLGLDFDQGIKDVRLNSSQALNLFRICQEAIQNCLKHSQATQIDISVEQNSGHLTFVIADNGLGCDMDQNVDNESYGLQNMRERAAEIGGNIHFESVKGDGFIVSIQL